MKKCAILHNMIANKREYVGTMKFKENLEEEEDLDLNLEEALDGKCRYEQARQWREK